MTAPALLLIGRKNGKSSTRRQRRFPDQAAIDRAIERWTREGFNVFWLYEADGGPLIRQWRLDDTTTLDTEVHA